MIRPGEAHEPDDGLTHAMMIAALNRALADCGYDPVSCDDEPAHPEPAPVPPGPTGADRLIAEARQRADGIVAAALETAVQYTDAALDRAARTVFSARGILAALPDVAVPPETAGSAPVAARGGAGVGDLWFAAIAAAGVYLPIAEDAASRTLGVFAACLHDAARAVPPDLAAAHRVGAEVVALGVGRPEALPASLGLVLDHLSEGEVVDRPARQVAGAFAAGFTAALQARTLAQQEALHRAAHRAAREFRSALQHSEARYHRLAHYDPVTGLANKARLVQRLRQSANGADPGRHVGLCLIELGGLAAAGERFGAAAGDQVLTEVAHRLQPLARHPDYLLARHGAHSFVLLVQDSGGLAHLAELAGRITTELAAPVALSGTGPAAPLHAAVGVVDVPTAGLDVTRVLVDAEIAVRQARTGTTGWAAYQPQPAGPGAATGISGLVTGPPSYQPVVGLGSGRVAGLHTRTAWRHPHLGILDLRRIGQLTGDRDTVTRLAGSLLRQACRQAMTWDGSRRGPFIGLDLPVHEIGYPDVAELVREALAGSGLPPERLHLHLSGLDAVPAGEHSHTVLIALAALGVRLELDDFGSGTGPGSLAYLRELPLHGLRTPAALIRSPGTGAEADRALLAGLAGVAHALGLTLTVHGVDDDAARARLTGSGVDSAQGLRFGPPSTPHQVPALLRGPGALAAVPERRVAS